VADKELRRRNRHYDDRLDQLNHGERNLIENLQCLARNEQNADQEADNRNDNRVVARQERNYSASRS
jgi:hypothetical protein